SGGERAPLTVAAVACMFSAGEYNSGLAKQWLRYCQANIPIAQVGRFGHDEYTHYYYAQVLYILGEQRFPKLFPEAKESEQLTWSKYRKAIFDDLARTQSSDGSWMGGCAGPIFATTVYLSRLSLVIGSVS